MNRRRKPSFNQSLSVIVLVLWLIFCSLVIIQSAPLPKDDFIGVMLNMTIATIVISMLIYTIFTS